VVGIGGALEQRENAGIAHSAGVVGVPVRRAVFAGTYLLLPHPEISSRS